MSSLYQQSVPMMIKYMRNLEAILKKAEAFADEKGIKHEEVLNDRLIADQKPLVYQVQCCSNTAKFLAVRIGGMENVVLEDNEATFEQLYARIERTVRILESLDPNCMNGAETKEIVLETAMGKFQFVGQEYVTMFAVPFFHFHLSTAYCVLRKMGVDIGALDYMKDVFHKVEE